MRWNFLTRSQKIFMDLFDHLQFIASVVRIIRLQWKIWWFQGFGMARELVADDDEVAGRPAVFRVGLEINAWLVQSKQAFDYFSPSAVFHAPADRRRRRRRNMRLRPSMICTRQGWGLHFAEFS
ncbi:hypothetical protein GUJ93_ZPchr0010g10436 [Zizania palustris]|uniref:Uncharacterized protein n=1 Tax=Zizania palustris TaxID=103762 RepID=A0A8J5WDE3_ZIZPA|nr:hypothetical protein GUJ93_ZPchr0010g10436 [Zizania palustris]